MSYTFAIIIIIIIIIIINLLLLSFTIIIIALYHIDRSCAVDKRCVFIYYC